MIFRQILGCNKKIVNKNARFCSSATIVASKSADKTQLTRASSALKQLKIDSVGQTKLGAFQADSPLTTVVFSMNAGSRYEPASALGISHVFSHSLLATTKRDNIVDLVRPLYAYGADIKVLNDRENLYLVNTVHKDYVDSVNSALFDCLHRHSNKFHEFAYAVDSCLIDYDNIVENAPHAYLLDSIHEYVFRSGLGNSLYAKPDIKSRIKHETMNDYRLNMITSKGAIACFGEMKSVPEIAGYLGTFETVDDLLLKGDTTINLDKSPLTTNFCPGELRMPLSRKVTHVALVMPGCSYTSPDYWKYLILQKFIANSPEKSYFPKSHSLLSAAVESSSDLRASEVAVDCFNTNYRDTGLFGVYMVAPNEQIHKLVSTVSAKLADFVGKSGKVPHAKCFEAAKNSAKLAFLSQFDSSEAVTVNLAKQLTETGSYTSPFELAAKFDSITADEFEKFAKKALSLDRSSLLLASLGDVQQVGTLDNYFKL